MYCGENAEEPINVYDNDSEYEQYSELDLKHMNGNVAEWTRDFVIGDPSISQSMMEVVNPASFAGQVDWDKNSPHYGKWYSSMAVKGGDFTASDRFELPSNQ